MAKPLTARLDGVIRQAIWAYLAISGFAGTALLMQAFVVWR